MANLIQISSQNDESLTEDDRELPTLPMISMSQPLLTLALLDMDQEIHLAALDESLMQQAGPSEKTETSPDEKDSGFSMPHLARFGSHGLVQSVPRDLEISSPDFALQFKKSHQETDSSVTGLFTSQVPDFLPPPSILVQPEIKINDTLVNEDDIALFQIQINTPQDQELTVGFTYPDYVTILGGNGVVSVDQNLHTGVIRVPPGSTSVQLEVQLNADSPLEPGQHFEIQLVDDHEGLEPIFVKPVGIAFLIDIEGPHTFATNDSYWTAIYDNENNYNLVFMLDVSASMNALIKDDQTKLQRAQIALVDFLDYYQHAADNLNITIIPFAAGEENQGAFAYHATSIQDAKDFVLGEGSHEGSGVAVHMINPNNGEELGRGTHYNDALYHARITLESDLVNPNLTDYAHMVYFISDGVPNKDHSATDQQDWPLSWGSWQSFIENPKHVLPTSFSDRIDAFAVSIGDDPRIEQAMKSVVNLGQAILSADTELATLSQQLLTTVPEYFHANVLSNDATSYGTLKVIEISFHVDAASQYVQDHQLQNLGATVTGGDLITIPLPSSQDFIQFDTPLGGKLWLNSYGELFYLSPTLAHDSQENFDYQVRNLDTNQSDHAHLELNIVGKTASYTELLGNELSNTLSSVGLEGIVVMEGHGGDNTFVIDMQDDNLQQILIRDLFDNPENTLKLVNTAPAALTLADVFNEVFQQGPFEALEFKNSQSNMTLVLDHPANYYGSTLPEALDYLGHQVHVELG